jgi:hypothetical protein
LAKNYSYTRVSDKHKQTSIAQHKIINKYASDLGLIINETLDIQMSGSNTNKEERGLISLIEKMKCGDRLLVSDIERLGRDSVSDIFEIITRVINIGASIHFCLPGEKITPDHKNDLAIIFTTIGKAFASQDFSKQRSLKASAAAKRRQERGLSAGRSKGAVIKSKLDPHEKQIIFWLHQDMSKAAIAKRLNVASSTFHLWLDRRDTLICLARDLNLYDNSMSIADVKEVIKRHHKNN